MNRYILIHRLTGPAILLLLGVVALLSEMHLAHFSIFVPLLLILLGVLKLAERAALAGYEYPAPGAGPQQPGGNPYAASGNGPGYGAGPGYSAGSGYSPNQGPGGPASNALVPRFHELETGSDSALGESGEEKR